MIAAGSWTFISPSSLEELETVLSEHGGEKKLMAGATDLFVKMQQMHEIKNLALISLSRIPELKRIVKLTTGFEIGSAVTVSEIAASAMPQALQQAAHSLASPSIRNTATVGGNVCNASPAADLSVALLALNADAIIRDSAGRERREPLESFFKGPGITTLKENEYLKALFIPDSCTYSCFVKLGVRAVMEIAIASCAVAIETIGPIIKNCKISLGSLGPVPYCCYNAEKAMHGLDVNSPSLHEGIARAALLAKESSKPISDMRASAEYRNAMAGVLVQRSLQEACKKAAFQ